jgi:two-component system chemotaxis response regulator CheB
LKAVLRDLPATLPVPLIAVQHLSPDSPGHIIRILTQAGALPVGFARHGEKLRPGHVYVAPPDKHLLVDTDGCAHLSRGPRENFARPAIDPTFRSVALVCGFGAIGIIGSGHLNDGTAGLKAIELMGGACLVQDPGGAEVPDMPVSALRCVASARPLKLDEIAGAVMALLHHPSPAGQSSAKTMREIEIEAAIAAGDLATLSGSFALGEPSPLTCPECHGALLEVAPGAPLRRYRCHTGHAFTAEVLLSSLKESSERAVWNAMRSLQEIAILSRHMAAHSADNGAKAIAQQLMEQSRSAQKSADKLRDFQSGME